MVAERAGYTVTMFLVDISRSMGNTRTVELPDGPNGEQRTKEMTNLQWSLQFAKLKIQEMIYNGRKTDQCGVVLFGSNETDNVVNEHSGGFEGIVEYIPIGTPNASTLAQLDALEASNTTGDAIDGVIVAYTIQDQYLDRKKTWTRKLVLITDGESPLELEEWQMTATNLNEKNVQFTLIGVDFDSDAEDFIFTEENKPDMKRVNEGFYNEFVSALEDGVIGTCAYAIQEISKPDIKITKSVMMRSMLSLGDYEAREEEAFAILIRTSKCTAISRPSSWSKYAIKPKEEDDEDVTVYAPLRMTSEYFFDKGEKDVDGDVPMKQEEDAEEDPSLSTMEQVDKETLVRGYKYGTTYVPCPDGEFAKLPTKSGMEICGFFLKKNFRRELSMGEIQYVWGDPDQPNNQVALSSIARAMQEKKVYAIARWVTKDERAPKMGVLAPSSFEEVDCLLWAPMPFADDVRKYTFPSLDHLVNKKGEEVKVHPYLPTEEQLDAMDNFVDAMDLMEAGDKDEEGVRGPWFDTRLSYNPALHRIKQAMFHSAVVNDLESNPLPPPHPEVIKYFDPPKKMLKRARDVIEGCKDAFKVREVPKKVAKTKKDGHAHARDDDDDLILLDKYGPAKAQSQINVVQATSESPSRKGKEKANPISTGGDDSATEDEDEEEELLLDKVGPPKNVPVHQPLPTPARSMSPEIDIDRGVEPGRIIGLAFPLQDFQKNLEAKDLVTKAVEDMGYVITQIVLKPFASRRTDELVKCMRAMRETCLTEDEIEGWNEFLVQLKAKCAGTPGNMEFWGELRRIGREISLISESEAEKNGGESDYSESKAKKFFA